MNHINLGQSGEYDKNATLIRNFAGDIRTCIELQNPLIAGILISKIDKFLQIINPEFKKEADWFNEAMKLLKLWSNDIVMSNRLLGIKNDNVYDTTVFEKVIVQHFFLKEKPKPDEIVRAKFSTLVELVELGVRRFGM